VKLEFAGFEATALRQGIRIETGFSQDFIALYAERLFEMSNGLLCLFSIAGGAFVP
jgi:hypothetical protein